jgi:hypothetical protein
MDQRMNSEVKDLTASILRPQKFATLPDEVQVFVNTLNQTPLAQLQAAMSSQDFFDFTGPPLEIRLMVYRLLLTSSSGSITPNFNGREKEQYLLPGTPLFTVNRQISSEAASAVSSTNTFNLDVVGRGYETSYILKAAQRVALRRFCKFAVGVRLQDYKTD